MRQTEISLFSEFNFQAIIAFVTLNSGSSLSARQIQDRLRKILVSYAVPQVYFALSPV